MPLRRHSLTEADLISQSLAVSAVPPMRSMISDALKIGGDFMPASVGWPWVERKSPLVGAIWLRLW